MVLTRVEIEDFDKFWATFSTRGAEKRKEHGSRGARVFRDAEDANRVYVLFDWDPADFERFMQDPEAPEIMASAGLKGRPERTFVEPAGELDS